jgi:hypothetical protein
MIHAMHGEKEMNTKALTITLTSLLLLGAGSVFACEYKAGETKFLDYANCRYGEDSVQAVKLSEDSLWEACIYHVEAFTPAKLLAVTMQKDGKEMVSINDRSKIGNPCYMTKQRCDAALKASDQ